MVSNDTVEWLRPTELTEPGEVVKIPAATMEQELSERKSFIQSADVTEDVKVRVAASLDAHSALGSFSKLIKAHGLSQDWHRHRFQSVVRRIRAWCTTTAVPWREEWVSSSDESSSTISTGDASPTKAQRHLFEQFVGGTRVSSMG